MEQLRGQLLSRASKNFEDRSKSALFAEARKHIADTSKSFSIQEVAADLNQLVADEIAKGSNPKDVDDAVLKAVGQTMMEKDGRDVSELFDLVKGSSGLSLRDVFGEKSSEYVRGVINNHHNLWRQNQRDKLEDERIREQDVRDQAADETIRFLMQNPSAPIDSIVRKYANERGAIASIANAAKQVYEVNAVEDPEIAEELYIEVYSGNLRKSAVMDRLAKGEFRLSTAAKAVQWIRQRDGEERALAAQARGESRADHQIRDQASPTRSFARPSATSRPSSQTKASRGSPRMPPSDGSTRKHRWWPSGSSGRKPMKAPRRISPPRTNGCSARPRPSSRASGTKPWEAPTVARRVLCRQPWSRCPGPVVLPVVMLHRHLGPTESCRF
jgi:hypothetical protein